MPRFTNRSGYEKKHWLINTEQLDHKDNAYMNFKVGKFCLQCLTSSPPPPNNVENYHLQFLLTFNIAVGGEEE